MAVGHPVDVSAVVEPPIDIRRTIRPADFERTSASKQFSILVIDDNSEDRRLLRLALKWVRFPVEITIQTADSCEDALRSLTTGTAPLPSLVLINLERKGIRCLKALENLKQSKRTRAVPVVAWAQAGDPLLDEAYAAQVNCLLRKPETVEDAELMLTRLVNFWTLPNIILPRQRNL
jgi:CheY-like chemotaxis protein